MPEFQMGFFVGAIVAGAVTLIFSLLMFKYKLDEYKVFAADVMEKNNSFWEVRLSHASAQSYSKGLAKSRLKVAYMKKRAEKDIRAGDPYAAAVGSALDSVMDKVGDMMQDAERDLQIKYNAIERHAGGII